MIYYFLVKNKETEAQRKFSRWQLSWNVSVCVLIPRAVLPLSKNTYLSLNLCVFLVAGQGISQILRAFSCLWVKQEPEKSSSYYRFFMWNGHTVFFWKNEKSSSLFLMLSQCVKHSFSLLYYIIIILSPSVFAHRF